MADPQERLKREAEFHDQWASDIDPATLLVDEPFTACTGVENKHILAEFGSLEGKRVLDYGCGACEGGIYLAKLGADVVGIDVSPGMLKAAEQGAEAHGVKIETRLVTEDRIPADNDEFDLIYGNGVLHHVDLRVARQELPRIMKPTGRGCFIEPLGYNPAVEAYRRIANTVRTDDERPLTVQDIEDFKLVFQEVSHKEFWFLTLALFFKFYLLDGADPKKERYWKKIYSDAPQVAWFFEPLRQADEVLLERAPFLRPLCWNTVITVAKPRP